MHNASSNVLYAQPSIAENTSMSPETSKRQRLKRLILLNSKNSHQKSVQNPIYVNEQYEEVDMDEDQEDKKEGHKSKSIYLLSLIFA